MKKLKIFISLLLSVTLISGCSNLSLSGNKSSELTKKETQQLLDESKEYLFDNHSVIANYDSTNFEGLELLDSQLDSKDIFFTGEMHGTQANAKLKMKFIKYFKEKANIKYILCENSYSGTYAVNKYLKTGDISIIDNIYDELKGTFVWTKDSYNFIKDLYQYNMTLPEEERLVMVGVDIEHQGFNAYEFLNDILPDEAAPESISKEIDIIRNIKKHASKRSEAYDISRDIQDSMNKNTALYENYLGDDFFGFKMVVDNLVNAQISYDVEKKDPSKWNLTRDKFIYENFKAVDAKLPEGKYFGQWGLNHIYQATELGTKWFGGYLDDESSKYHDRVMSIAYSYKNSQVMTREKNYTYGVGKLNSSFLITENAEKDIDSKLNLYKLDSENSPLSSLNLRVRKNDTGIPITEFYQYLLSIDGSEASEPLE